MILGIDFGTTKSVAAMMESGTPIAIPDIQGHRSMPSLVMVAPDERLYIGWEALAHPSRYQGEHFTISSIKRLMGKTGETTWGRFRTYPQEVSALVLGRLKMQAEAYCNTEISKAVIAVPAHFDINQRWATMQAAEIAGLKVARLLNEATAAALAYIFFRRKKEGTTLVFDFGGGTLDVSIVLVGEGVCEVQYVLGDDRLGGDDFDQIILDYLLGNLKQQCGTSLELSPMQHLVLKEAAAQAKIDLSGSLSTRIYLPGFLRSTKMHYDLDVVLERSNFEHLCRKLFDRAETMLKTAMDDRLHGYYRDDPLTDVILIGGTSRIPYIKESVRKITGLNPTTGVDPEVGVAQGASILAGYLSGELRDVLLMDVVPGTYSVELKGDVAEAIIWKNSTIPTYRKSRPFTTTKDDQTEVTISVFQGEKSAASQNTFVGEVRLTGLPNARAGVPQIEVTFDVDANNFLAVSAKDLTTGYEVRAVMEAPYRLNPAQMKVLKRKVEQELERLRRQEWEARERARYEAARKAATALTERVEGLLAVHRDALQADQASLLVSGKVLISDYLSRDASRDDLQTLVSSVRSTYKDALLMAAARTARLVADSPEFARWTAGATNNLRTPALLKASFEEFGNRFRFELDGFVALFQNEDAGPPEKLSQELLAKLRDASTAALCSAVILSHFARLHPDVRMLDITESKDNLLLCIFLLGELDERNPQIARRAAAQGIFLAYKGTDCLFLLEYLAAEADPEVVSWLERCLREIPEGCWLRRFLEAEPGERKRLTTNAVALQEVRRDALGALRGLHSSFMQHAALETLEVLGVQNCLPDLLPLLEIRLEEEVKTKLIRFVASSRHKQAIAPLIKVLAAENSAVQCAALVALEECKSLMAHDIRRFFEIAQRVIGREIPMTLWERPFLLRFAKKHRELSEVVRAVKQKR